MNVLLVDDDRLALDGLLHMLPWDALGAQIVGMAADGMEALCMARANHPDVVITDICMPGMDGLELVARLSEEPYRPEIFLLSGHDEFEYARRAMHYGVKHYLLKPITRETIGQLGRDLAVSRERLSAKQAQHEMLCSQAHEEALRRALAQGDMDTLEATFDELERQAKLVEENTVALCIWLLNILYRHLLDMRMDEEATKRSRRHSIEEMLALQSREDKLFFVQQKFFSVAQTLTDKAKNSQTRIALQARKLIGERFMQPDFNIASLSRELGLTASYVSTVFRQSEGISMSAYLTDLRLEHARKLLTGSSASISEIARISGYIDAHYFAKIFKKKYRITPSEFRNLTGQEEKFP